MASDTFHGYINRLRDVFPGAETITIPKAAAYYQCAEETLRSDKDFPARRCGRFYRVTLINFAKWLEIQDEEIEKEIRELETSPYVELAQKEETLRIGRREYLKRLRSYRAKGKELARDGVTVEHLERLKSADWAEIAQAVSGAATPEGAR